MKFYLIKNETIELNLDMEESVEHALLKGSFPTGPQQIQTNVIPVDTTVAQVEMCQKLKKLLHEFLDLKMKARRGYCKNEKIKHWNMDLLIRVAKSPRVGDSHLKGQLKLVLLRVGHCLEALRDLSDREATFNVDMGINRLGSKRYRLISPENSVNPGQGAQYIEYTSMQFPPDTLENWSEGGNSQLKASISIMVTVPDDILTGQYKSRNRELSRGSIPLTRKLLEHEILTDVVLIPECGTLIKAHKAILAGQSSVFLTMFQTNMSDVKESFVEVPDMCEDSVRALLKYCYYEDMKAAEESSIVCFALYIAAHKYDIEPLETKTREILVNKESNFAAGWWNVDVAVKLFHFLRKLIPCDEELKIKAVQVLKTCTGKLGDSPSYRELFERDNKAAMELCQYAFTMRPC